MSVEKTMSYSRQSMMNGGFRTCQGFVKENGKVRPCKKTGNAIYANGYCASHQFIAVMKLKEQLERI